MKPKFTRRELIASAAAMSATVFAASLSRLSHAQEKFPSRPITLICPWPPGGSSDAVMRALAESVSKTLGVSVVVENKPGAGGTLGAAAMVTAKPDGYTITQLPLGIYRIPHMQKTAFDPIKDLTHVICLTGYTFGLVVPADSPFKTLDDMVKAAKASPGAVNYGHTGIGTTPHLAIEEFSQKAGITLNHIPYKGSAEILAAILGGQLMMMSGTTEFAPHVESGKLRMLATLGRARTKQFPKVPTVKELGYDTITESPFGIGAPKGVDPTIVKALHDAFKKTLDDPKVLATFEKFHQPTIYMSTAEYTAYAERTFNAERLTIQRLGLDKKS
jgi:tripartite-type tricarboxylate transporter receptor subunit TctC